MVANYDVDGGKIYSAPGRKGRSFMKIGGFCFPYSAEKLNYNGQHRNDLRMEQHIQIDLKKKAIEISRCVRNLSLLCSSSSSQPPFFLPTASLYGGAFLNAASIALSKEKNFTILQLPPFFPLSSVAGISFYVSLVRFGDFTASYTVY
ncbi:GPN-loop GTPase 3 homolog AGL117C [Striga asiatica]|uniref:GPN-loop GTPase 3 homolog AGL117C n=1 Tax=Striga asiatica TaxID=4170 RepID=A0A5A7Q4U1_STRAF|nr:GPN-loop GTPase 3 homolog AGL117C [Striga asiatica]